MLSRKILETDQDTLALPSMKLINKSRYIMVHVLWGYVCEALEKAIRTIKKELG